MRLLNRKRCFQVPFQERVQALYAIFVLLKLIVEDGSKRIPSVGFENDNYINNIEHEDEKASND